MVGCSVLVTVLVTKLRFVTNELDHTSFEHTKIYCREILIIISGKFLKAMIENFNNWNNFKYLKMNRLNIYSYLTKIQPRSVNTLSITAILTTQDSNFIIFNAILVIFVDILVENSIRGWKWGHKSFNSALTFPWSLRIVKKL